MFTKIKSNIKYYSFIIFPLLSCIMCLCINKFTKIFNVNDTKIQILVSVSASFIGVLLTILTIYLAVPKNEHQLEKFRDSFHEQIYIRNIIMGIIMFFLAIFTWFFGDSNSISSIMFLSGTTNIAISMYYTFSLIKLL